MFVLAFDMDGEKYYAWYESGGTWVGIAYVINDNRSYLLLFILLRTRSSRLTELQM